MAYSSLFVRHACPYFARQRSGSRLRDAMDGQQLVPASVGSSTPEAQPKATNAFQVRLPSPRHHQRRTGIRMPTCSLYKCRMVVVRRSAAARYKRDTRTPMATGWQMEFRPPRPAAPRPLRLALNKRQPRKDWQIHQKHYSKPEIAHDS